MSTIRTNTLSNVAGTQSTAIENAINGSAKAWVNFSSYGSNTIYGSYNVSSVVDDGSVGKVVINFTNPMPDTNYAVVYGVGDYNINWNGGASLGSTNNGWKTTTQTALHLSNNTFTDTQYYEISIVVFR